MFTINTKVLEWIENNRYNKSPSFMVYIVIRNDNLIYRHKYSGILIPRESNHGT
jgi:hypothetical protein